MSSAQKISMRTDVPPPADAPATGLGIPFIGHRSPFLRRTLWATLITLGLVALNLAVYLGPGLGGLYLLTGLWSIVFFCLTPLILKELFEGRPVQALLLAAGKIAWIALLLAGCYWAAESIGGRAFVAATLGGITTPLAVLALRAAGAAMNKPNREPAAGDAKKLFRETPEGASR